MIVQIDSSVTEEQRQDPRFLKLLRDVQRGFSPKYQQLIALHEGAHAYFARKAGATNIVFRGTTMWWDSRINPATNLPYDCPAVSRSSCAWTIPAGTPELDGLKASVAGYVCRRMMSDTPNDAVSISMDLEGVRKQFESIGGTEEEFRRLVAEAEKAVTNDLQSPVVREGIWAEAKRFQQEIFPAPKLTSGLLRARRLGWMQ